MLKNKLLVYIFLVFYIILSNSAMACACFNSGFLISIFSDSAKTICDAQINDRIISAIRINDGSNQAYTDSMGCTLNADYHSISRGYDPMTYVYENNQCINEILRTCKYLRSQLNYY